VVRGPSPGDRELYVTQIFTRPTGASTPQRAGREDTGIPLLTASRP
jgi:hypothetical protein